MPSSAIFERKPYLHSAQVSCGDRCVRSGDSWDCLRAPGSVASVVVSATEGPVKRLSVEHPSGEFSLEIEVDNTTSTRLQVRSSLIRTARALFRGDVLVPASIWDGSTAQTQ
jgi:2-methylaconitate cis-trans-isomerase PrpF